MNDDNPTLRYYDAEMRYLREAGREFAEAFPDRAAHLGLDRDDGLDPFVERLLEGFAFLMGRLRQKLDDDLPELTEGLVSLIWPHYLRTIPSLAVVALEPLVDQLKGTETLPAGFEVLTQPIGPKGTRCPYATTRTIRLQPLSLDNLQIGREACGRDRIRLSLRLGSRLDWGRLDLADLMLYINADTPMACALHHALTLNLAEVWITPEGQPRRSVAVHVAPAGFGPDDRLWPQADNGFGGHGLLLEYFTFPEKFRFVTLKGLEHAGLVPGTRSFALDLVLTRPWPAQYRVQARHLSLHAVPVINLFSLDADPLELDPLQSQYLLRPLRLQDGHIEIYSVDRVTGHTRQVRHDYVPFSSFQHQSGTLRDEAPERYFHTRLRRAANGLHDTWLILGGEGSVSAVADDPERLSLSLTGTNGSLPRKALQDTVIDTALSQAPVPLTVRNLCRPSVPCAPPDQDRFHWRVLGHLGSAFLSMLDNPEVLRGTLALYDWTHSELNRRRLAAIVQVRHRLIQRFEGGLLVRGVDIEITLDRTGFTGEGDICLFGELLSRFFGLYADVHLFTQLTLVLQPDGARLQWHETHNPRVPG